MLLIDDMVTSRMKLAHLVKKCCPDISVIGQSDRISEGLESIKNYKPDIVFLDVRLTKGDDNEILDHYKRKRNYYIIFTTVKDEKAIKILDDSGFYYLLKPITDKALTDAVCKANLVDRQTISKEKIEQLIKDFRKYHDI